MQRLSRGDAGIDAIVLGTDGFFFETIAFPCSYAKYSMPLGIVPFAERAYFRVFKGARLAEHLHSGGSLLLLHPLDPALYAESLLHTLELSLEWNGECPVPEPSLGYWHLCAPVSPLGWDGYSMLYTCTLTPLGGTARAGYTRAYGCTIELLVHATKVAAGVTGLDIPFVRRMLRCIARSGRYGGDNRLYSRVLRALQHILGALPETSNSEDAL